MFTWEQKVKAVSHFKRKLISIVRASVLQVVNISFKPFTMAKLQTANALTMKCAALITIDTFLFRLFCYGNSG